MLSQAKSCTDTASAEAPVSPVRRPRCLQTSLHPYARRPLYVKTVGVGCVSSIGSAWVAKETVHGRNIDCRALARIALCRVEGYPRYFASVDSGRRQNSPHTDTMAQPLVARRALCDGTWADDFADPLARRRFPN